MAPRFLVALTVAMGILALGKTDVPKQVCQEATTSDTLDFEIPTDLFYVDIEVVSVETGRVTNMNMMYSQSKNIIKLSNFDDNKHSDYYFYFSDNELLTFDYSLGRGTCTVNSDLMNSPETFIIGDVKEGGKIPTAFSVLHFRGKSGFGDNMIALTSIGENTVRDMQVQSYWSCQKWSVGSSSAILNVTHHFSVAKWTRPDSDIVPVTIEIQGSAVIHNKAVDIHHYYNFFNYKSYFDLTLLETPPGIMCEGRNADVPFPNLPQFIKFNAEQIDHSSGSVKYIEEIFDSISNVAVMRSQGAEEAGSDVGIGRFTVIRDYPTGLSYFIDNKMRSCIIQNITDASKLPLDFITPQGKARILTPDQFFYKKDAKYEYLGERKVRGQTADTWVTKTVMPDYPDVIVTVEWYFAKASVRSPNDDSSYYTKNHIRMPLLFRVWMDDSTFSTDVSFYHVDFTKQMFGQLDIRDCYPNRVSNYFQLILPGAKKDVINANIERFKLEATYEISQAANIRPIRIADLKVYYEKDDAIIEFEMLDAPPFASDVDGPQPKYLSLKDATTRLQKSISNQQLYLTGWDSDKNDMTKPIRIDKSAKIKANGDPSSSGYSTGAMAGLGIAMIIVGGAGGGAGAFFFLK